MKSYCNRFLGILIAIAIIASGFSLDTIIFPVKASKTPVVYSQLTDKASFNYPGGSGSTYSSSGCGIYSIVNAIQYLNNLKIDPHTLGNFAISCGGRVNGGVTHDFAEKVAKSKEFGGKYCFRMTERYTFGSSSNKISFKKSNGTYQTNSGYPSSSTWSTLHAKLVNHLSKGEVAIVLVLGHYMSIVDYEPSSDKFLILDSAPYKGKRLNSNNGLWQWVTANEINFNTNKGYPYIQLRTCVTFFESTNNVDYTNPDNYSIPERDLYYNGTSMIGNDIGWVQAVLYQLDYVIDVDQMFGPATKAVVIQFQKDNGLNADGKVNAATRDKLIFLWNKMKFGVSAPSWAKITGDSKAVKVGNKIVLTPSSDSGTKYTIGIDKYNSVNNKYERIQTKDISAALTYTCESTGNYSAVVTAYNESGSIRSSVFYWGVYSPVTWAKVTASATNLKSGQTVLLTPSSDNATNYTIGINKNNVRLLTEDINEAISYTCVVPGDYSAVITAYNEVGSLRSEEIHWSVYSAPNKATLQTDAEVLTNGQSVNLTFSSDQPAEYVVQINRNDKAIETKTVSGDLYSFACNQSGFYSAFVTATNDAGSINSETVSWFVNNHSIGADFYAYIRNKNSAKLLSNNGGLVKQSAATKENCETKVLWHFIKQGNNSYIIYNVYDGSCISLDNNSTSSQTKLISKSAVGIPTQQWYLSAAGNGTAEGFYLRNAVTNKVAEIADASISEGANAQISQRSGCNEQVFLIETLNEYKKPEKPISPTLSVEKVEAPIIEMPESFNFSWTASALQGDYDARSYKLVVMRDGEEYISIKNISETSKMLFLPIGEYTAYVRAVNYQYNSYYSDSNIISFSVANEEHDWQWETTNSPTCTEEGSQQLRCTICGKVSISQTVGLSDKIPPLGHSFGVWKKQNESEHQRVCSRNASHIELKPHNWNEGVLTSATCSDEGSIIYTCIDCGAEKTEILPVLPHDYGDWLPTDENRHMRVCKDNLAHIEYSDHIWDEGIIEEDATIFFDGFITYTCLECGSIKKELIPALPHEHEWDEGVVIVPATTTETGEQSYCCTICGETKTEIIPKLKAKVLSTSDVNLNWTSKSYNGAVQKPTVTVTGSTGNIITEGKSYTVTYSAESKTPGSYTVTVKGMGNYTGTVKKTYTITKQPLVASNITLSWTSKAYNGSVQKPTVTVKSSHGTTISEGSSYTLVWSGDCKAAGTYTVTVTGAGKFTGTVKKTFTIASGSKHTIAASDVTLNWTSKAYNGAVQQPAVTVKGSTGNVITEGKSYTVTYSADSKAPGSYTVTVKGMGNYSGTVKKTYTITKQPLVAANITLSWTTKAYNGSVQKPTVTVKSTHGTTISEGGSYTLTWSGNCKAAGTYTVTITGAGKFTGTVKKTFTIASGSKHTIAASDVTLSWTSTVYNNTVQKPTVTVKGATGNVITEGKSYTVSYSDENKNAGSYTVTVTGMGSYEGTVTKTYTITKQELDASRVTLSKTSFTYNGSVQQPKVTVKSAAGNILTEGGSYVVSYSVGCKAKGTYTVFIMGEGNYTGTVTKTFTIK